MVEECKARKRKPYPAQSRIRELFEYRDGHFYRLTAVGDRLKVGDRSGWFNRDGYLSITVDGRQTRSSVAVWIYHHGEIPAGMMVDHINHDVSDNRIENLRLATNAENQDNRKGPTKNSKTGVRNVFWMKTKKKYKVEICHRGVLHYFGLFSCIKDAEKFAIAKRAELKGEFAGS